MPRTGKKNALIALYDEAGLPTDVRKSLSFIMLGNICGNAFGIICGSSTTAMVGLATKLGANDLAFGIIAAIVQVSAVLQIPFAALVGRTQKRKKYMLTWGLMSRIIWLFFGFIPYIVPEGTVNLRLWSLIFLLGMTSALGAMINVCWFPWFSDLAPIQIRGRWMSIRDMWNAFIGVLVGLLVAFMLDYLPESCRYTIVFTLGGILGICDMLSFSQVKEVYSMPPMTERALSLAKDVLKDKPFMHFVFTWTFWCFSWNVDSVFLTPYSMNVMGLNALQIMIFSTIASGISTLYVAQHWGRALFHYGSRNVMMIGCIGSSLMHLFYLFAVPGNVWPTFLFNFLGAMFWTGCNLSANNLQLSLSTDDKRPGYIAVFSCITAFMGSTLGSLSGGWFLDCMAASDISFGILDRYKVLFIFATVLRCVGMSLLIPGLQNENDRTAADLLKVIFLHRER